MSEPLRLGIAGLGTVGGGVVKIVQKHAKLLEQRAGRPVVITAVSARSRKDRGFDVSAYHWVENAIDLVDRDDVDVVIEMIGGSEGIAKTLVKSALENGKHVVTANKALLAHHGYELAKVAEDNNVALAYEAAVAGGIPVIKTIREDLSGNEITAVYGILNGTCNYMLTAMRETGKDFDVILQEAQDAGYAEADPTFDIDGIDAGHKLCLLTSLAFGVKPDFDQLKITGIRSITSADIECAEELGYRIKLLGITKQVDGQVLQVLEPCLVPKEHPVGQIEDVYNAVFVEGDAVDNVLLTGRGAGEGPTASAVMTDVMDIARGFTMPSFGVSADELETAEWMDIDDSRSRYYLRLNVRDQAGVIADIAAILKEHQISIESLIQHGYSPGGQVSVLMTIHETFHGEMVEACREFSSLDVVLNEPCLIRMETLS